MMKHVNGVDIPMTPEEIAELDASRATPPPTVPQLQAYVANARWKAETGGITVGGIAVHTDDRSKMMLMGARVHAAADPGFTTPWKTSDGSFVILDAATITALSNAVLAHVNACFAREAEVQAAILEETVTTTAAIDGAFADVNVPWE
mgnify:CR=1 FL=1